MNTKEAIEFIEGHRVDDNDLTGYFGKITHYKKDIKMYNQVIKLLQRGEKYEAMWGELINKKGWVFMLKKDIHNIFLYDVMKKLEQKYFPKGGTQ